MQTAESADVTAFLGTISPLKMHQLLLIASSNSKIHTIEAGLVLAQCWAERKRRILLIVPASLRMQWRSELSEKFFIDSVLMESASFNKAKKAGNLNPFEVRNAVVICFSR